MVIGKKAILNLIVRYDGIGKPLTYDEKEILMFVLYNESEARGGIVKEARAIEEKKVQAMQR